MTRPTHKIRQGRFLIGTLGLLALVVWLNPSRVFDTGGEIGYWLLFLAVFFPGVGLVNYVFIRYAAWVIDADFSD